MKQVLAMRRALLAADNPQIGRTLYNLATLENHADSLAVAEPHYEEAVRLMRQAYGLEPLALRVLAIEDSLKEDSLGRVMAGELARIYEATGREERAERYRARGTWGR